MQGITCGRALALETGFNGGHLLKFSQGQNSVSFPIEITFSLQLLALNSWFGSRIIQRQPVGDVTPSNL